MKFKKMFAAALSCAMLTSAFTDAVTASAAYEVTQPQISQGEWKSGADGEQHYIYFYYQLRPEAKLFYNALLDMYESGTLKDGAGSYNLTENNVVTQAQLAGYDNGDKSLLNAYGAARDAFCADHPEVFWVDFDLMTITVTQKQDGSYTASIGAGRENGYYRQGYASSSDVEAAIDKINAAADVLVSVGNAAVEGGQSAEEAPAGQSEAPASPGPSGTPIVLDLNDLRPGTSYEEKHREKTDDEKKITAIHDKMIRETVYKLDTSNESDPKHCQPENVGHVRTAYGPLVAHESLCEGYSKAMKLVLDKAHIPCVTVQGVYKHTEDQPELHMWNCVKIRKGENSVWYGVDATFDDPSVFNGAHMNDVDSGHESTEYLLVGADIMDRQHVESGEMSECGFAFKYPVLEMSGVSFDTVYSLGGLDVQYSSDCNEAFNTNMSSSTPAFKVSYNGRGYTEAAKTDKMYILVKFYGLNTETEGGKYSDSGWIYADTGLYDPQEFGQLETDEYVLFPAWQSQYMEFAVTDIPPKGHWYPGQTIPENPDVQDPESWDPYPVERFDYQYFTGDPTLFSEQTGMLYNPYEVQYPVPFVKRSTPSMSGRFYIEDGSKECEIIYDQPLVRTSAPEAALADANETAEIPLRYGSDFTVAAFDKIDNAALGNVRVDKVVSDMRLVGDRTIKFTLTPDESWAGDTIAYDITITGLQGAVSGMQPMTISFVTSHRSAVCAYRSRGYFWNLFAKPQLMENTDISVNDWTTSDGLPADQSLSNRIALVVSETGKAQSGTMNDMIEEKTGSEILSSSTYDLSLTICNKNILQTGTSVRLCVGFPAPYGPEDEGVKFTAYHFIKDSHGNTTDVEEIPCEVTKYGLVILCSSFSPFAITASEMTEQEKADKTGTVTVFNNAGGTVTSDSADDHGIIRTAPDGEAPVLTIAPDEGYAIDTIYINGEALEVPAEKGSKASVSVEWKEGVKNTIVDVTFAKIDALNAEEAHARETGERFVKPAQPAPMGNGSELTGTVTFTPEGGAAAEVTNASSEYQGKVRLILASYENGAFKACRSVSDAVYTNSSGNIELEALPDEDKTDDIRAFLWTADTLRPIEAPAAD